GKDDAQHAVEAAQEIQAGFATLAEAWQRDFGIRAAVSQGLHCGDAVVGFAKESPTPEQLFVFGDCVSIANRLLHRARAGEFVLSETLMDLAAEMGVTIDAEELPALEIPRREPINMRIKPRRMTFGSGLLPAGMPISFIHALPRIGPYQRKPSTIVAATATSIAQ